jgi:small subunit ribosomal protein S9e
MESRLYPRQNQVRNIKFIVIRKAARELLTLSENNQKRIFEGDALMNRMHRIGVLNESEKKLDYVLGLTLKQFLDRRLQTIVFNSRHAKSIHEARCLIFQKKISINRLKKRQIVNVPSYIVCLCF